MVFALAILTNVLLATMAFARPSVKERVERRRAGSHLSQPKKAVDGAVGALQGNTSHVEYSSNWAGAVWESSSGTYKSVTGTFVVPTPKAGSGLALSYSASAWVGIDGDTCGTSILQTGIDFTYTLGFVSYDAWYEWYPDYAYDFSGFSISAGDTIKLTVTATTTRAGTANIQNLSTGKSVSKALTSTAALCEENAEWIVEDYEEGSSLVPFANFGTVTFTDALATTSSGSTIGPLGSTLIDIEQSGSVLTSVTTGLTGLTVKYV